MIRIFILALAVATAMTPSTASAPHPNALWRVVHSLCMTDMKISGLPAPCMAVDRRGGFAVLKDLRGRTQVLLIPTVRVSGIESPKLQAAGSPNYWRDAWSSRRYFEALVGHPVPRQEIGLAINSIYGRSQNQLHIHIDCVRPDVVAALQAHQAQIGPEWRPLDAELAGARYRAMRLTGEDLGDRDPFKLLAHESRAVRADMGRQTLVVIGFKSADGQPGFVLLAATGDTPENPAGAGESLLDHNCRVLEAPGEGAAPN